MSDDIRPVYPKMTETPYFYIRNRTITPPYEYPDITVEQDSCSRILHFIAPRYFDGEDWANKSIRCCYINAQTGYEENEVSNIKVSNTEIEFDWTVPRGALVRAGHVDFDVMVYDEDEDYEWHTKPYPLKVADGLDFDTKGSGVLPNTNLQVKIGNRYTEKIIVSTKTGDKLISFNDDGSITWSKI